MSRRLWRCRNLACPTQGGGVLGTLTNDGGLVLDPSVRVFRVYLDTRRVRISCPACGGGREWLLGPVYSAAESGGVRGEW